MVGQLVMLPVRVGLRVTRLWFRAVEESVSLTSGATGRVVGLLASRSPNGPVSEAPARQPTTNGRAAADVEGDRPETPSEQPVRELRSAPPASPTETKPTPEPAHVSEEPILVDEFAEPGAEDGAGAQVRVDPPWENYEQMNAKQVIARLAGSDPAELATVQLYESMGRRRQTVMNAVERELRSRSRPNQ